MIYSMFFFSPDAGPAVHEQSRKLCIWKLSIFRQPTGQVSIYSNILKGSQILGLLLIVLNKYLQIRLVLFYYIIKLLNARQVSSKLHVNILLFSCCAVTTRSPGCPEHRATQTTTRTFQVNVKPLCR